MSTYAPAVATPLPAPGAADLAPPDAAQVDVISRAIASAAAPPGGLTQLQRLMLAATVQSMTGFPATVDGAPIDPAELGAALARRDLAFRSRIVQQMLLHALVLRPLPEQVADRVCAYASELGVHEEMIGIARGAADEHLGLAAVDFDRNGYVAELGGTTPTALHTSRQLDSAWAMAVDDPDLAARWAALERLPEGTLGRRLTEMYRARGFRYPGLPGSAPPLLAQHDWVHVVADYGTTVESELEVFAFIARANDDTRAFSLLAMVISLFETGVLASGAGLFQADAGHLERQGMAERVADALLRGARCQGSIDFMGLDWFELAAEPVEAVRAEFGVTPKSPAAVAAGSVGPWQAGGISPFQLRSGQAMADADGRRYDSFGASVEA